jgi:hypothetical protein
MFAGWIHVDTPISRLTANAVAGGCEAHSVAECAVRARDRRDEALLAVSSECADATALVAAEARVVAQPAGWARLWSRGVARAVVA